MSLKLFGVLNFELHFEPFARSAFWMLQLSCSHSGDRLGATDSESVRKFWVLVKEIVCLILWHFIGKD
jgi:hypothetical protein